MMVALTEGRKSQTRRFAVSERPDGRGTSPSVWFSVAPGAVLPTREPVYREAIEVDARTGTRKVEAIAYRAEGESVTAPAYLFRHGDAEWTRLPDRSGFALPHGSLAWSNPRFMPLWATRVSVTLGETRRERLQDITDADAEAEGASERAFGWCMDWSGVGRFSKHLNRALTEADIAMPTPRDAFRAYWNYLHSPKGRPATSAPWDANPELVVICFSAVTRLSHAAWDGARP